MSVLNKVVLRLKNSGVLSAQVEAEIILSEILNKPLLDIRAFPLPKLTNKEQLLLNTFVSRRENHEPLQYILGHAWFMNLCLEVGPGVLIPRPETETAVEFVCARAKADECICDLGTGSGTIALSIAFERPDLAVTAVDNSEVALQYAMNNRNKYKLQNVTIIKSDLFTELSNQRFDWVIANLPYVTDEEYNALPVEVLQHEPESALRAGVDGLDVIRVALNSLTRHLNPGGKAIFEIGELQGKKAKELFQTNGNFKTVELMPDLTDRIRFVYAELN
jgi:release factor glutamine methyltransferase